MPIQYQCACGHQIVTHDERAGRYESCPSCRMSVLVPESPQPEPKKEGPARGIPGQWGA